MQSMNIKRWVWVVDMGPPGARKQSTVGQETGAIRQVNHFSYPGFDKEPSCFCTDDHLVDIRSFGRAKVSFRVQRCQFSKLAKCFQVGTKLQDGQGPLGQGPCRLLVILRSYRAV